jgi:hypothetical protein
MAHDPHHHSHDTHTHHEREYVVERDSGTGVGLVLGVILAIILAVVLLWFLFSANLFNTGPGTTNPAQPGTNPSIDINVNDRTQPAPPPAGGTGGDTAPGTGGDTAPARP